MSCVRSLSIIFILCCQTAFASEYGGKWTDESIREHSIEYIEGVKKRFHDRASRLSEFLERPVEVTYRDLPPHFQDSYDKFLQDRLTEKKREDLFQVLNHQLEGARQELAKLETEAYKKWEALDTKDIPEAREKIDATIYGTEMSASNLGVILDTSPSMRPYVEAVRQEIITSFPDAQFLEVDGSGVSLRSAYAIQLGSSDPGPREILDDSWYYTTIPSWENPFHPKWHEPKIFHVPLHIRQVQLERTEMAALIALIDKQGVDTLYWFSDCEDDIEPRALAMLKKSLSENDVTFYLHSSRRRPDKQLIELVEETGGEIIRKRIR